MAGFRGVSRYLSGNFMMHFRWNAALRFVRNDMGLDNVEVMVPCENAFTG